MYEFVEEYLLKNFMEINSTLYIGSKLTLDIQKRGTKELFDLLEDYMDDLISNQIDALIDVLTEEWEENEKEFYIAITKIYLRMSLIFGTKKDFKGFIKCMKKELELMEVNNNEFDNIIREVLSDEVKDRELPHVLSLRK